MNLGKKITNLRKKEKITQEHLAELLGVTRQTISNWEQNITKPDINQIMEISNIFHISIDELLGNNIKNIIIEKVNKTEKVVNKNTKNIKILVITIYFIILLSLILVTIYMLTKKDFTKKYQTEFNCTTSKGILNVAVYEENIFNDISNEEESSDNLSSYEYYIVISKYDEEYGGYHEEERINAGKSLSDIFEGLEIVKKVILNDPNAKCR